MLLLSRPTLTRSKNTKILSPKRRFCSGLSVPRNVLSLWTHIIFGCCYDSFPLLFWQLHELEQIYFKYLMVLLSISSPINSATSIPIQTIASTPWHKRENMQKINKRIFSPVFEYFKYLKSVLCHLITYFLPVMKSSVGLQLLLLYFCFPCNIVRNIRKYSHNHYLCDILKEKIT